MGSALSALSQFLSHSRPSAAVHQRPPGGHRGWSRTAGGWPIMTALGSDGSDQAGSALPRAASRASSGLSVLPWA